MYQTYFIKCSSFLLFLSIIYFPGSSFAQKITVSGLQVKKLSEYGGFNYPAYENITIDGNGEYNESRIKFDDSPNIIDPGCVRIAITYEIGVDVNAPEYLVIKAYIAQQTIGECGQSSYPITRLFLSFIKPCFDGIPCDGWSDGARLSGACTIHPDIPAPKITGKTDICPGESTTLQATCEYGSPIWDDIWADKVAGPYLYTGLLDQTTTFKVKCKTDCKEGPESAATVTVHNSAVESIAHSVLPGNLDVAKAIRLAGTDISEFKICVDASTSSLFTVKGTCLASTNAQIEPPLGINDNNPDILGSISQSLSKPDNYESDLHLIYQHPSILPEEHLEPYSVNTLTIFKPGSDGEYEKALSRKLHIYPAPVAMVHGLWSNGEAFLSMGENLSKKRNNNSSYYPNDLLGIFDYRGSHDNSFQDNADVIPERLTLYISTLMNKRYAVRKVDIVAHSMGGLLARQYIQSQEYRDDIRKLIFINTPHSGSHMADFLLNPKWEFLANPFNRLILPIFSGSENSSIYNGAVEDLQINSTQIDNVINDPERVSFRVPYHAIVTNSKITPPQESKYDIDPKNLIFEVCDFIIDKIFMGDRHDLIVARTSQWGDLPWGFGWPDHISEFNELENINHIGSTKDIAVIERVRFLLAQAPNTNYFNRNGLKPENLVYNGVSASPGEVGNWLKINSISERKKLRSGTHQKFYVQEFNQKVRLRKLKVISIDADKNCRAKIINVGGTSSKTSNYEITFDFEAPDVVGRNDLIFLAISETGELAVQTTHFVVSNSFCESTKSGLWNSPQSWSCGHIPAADDPVVIKSGHIITIPQGIEGVCSQIDIESGASLKNQGELTVTND